MPQADAPHNTHHGTSDSAGFVKVHNYWGRIVVCGCIMHVDVFTVPRGGVRWQGDCFKAPAAKRQQHNNVLDIPTHTHTHTMQ